ncbi:MAG: c-type cytochrome domain-containing protein [Rubripirellula sp.]
MKKHDSPSPTTTGFSCTDGSACSLIMKMSPAIAYSMVSIFIWVSHCQTGHAAPEEIVASATNGLAPHVQAYLKQHCYQCHGEKKQKADRRMDRFPTSQALDEDARDLLEEALERIKLLTDDSAQETDPDTDDKELD